MIKKQKDIFLESEGNAWFERNRVAIEERNFGENDPIICAIDACLVADPRRDGAVNCWRWDAEREGVCLGWRTIATYSVMAWTPQKKP